MMFNQTSTAGSCGRVGTSTCCSLYYLYVRSRSNLLSLYISTDPPPSKWNGYHVYVAPQLDTLSVQRLMLLPDINNVGAMSQALYAYNNPNYDPIEAARWQSTQVSSISLMNCAGRIIIGFISDLLKARWSIPRSYSLVLVSIICCFSQALVLGIDEIQDLSFASSVLGLGYGAVFSLLPNVCMEWFGLSMFLPVQNRRTICSN